MRSDIRTMVVLDSGNHYDPLQHHQHHPSPPLLSYSSSQSLLPSSPLLGALLLLEHKQQSRAPSSLLSTSSWANSRLKAENSTLRFFTYLLSAMWWIWVNKRRLWLKVAWKLKTQHFDFHIFVVRKVKIMTKSQKEMIMTNSQEEKRGKINRKLDLQLN